MRLNRKRGLVAMMLIGGLLAAACSSNSSSSTTTTAASGGSTPKVSVTSFTNDFTAMSDLHGLAAEGHGKVAVILPDTVSSARYTEFDAPDLTRAFTTAGLSASEFSVQNAQGSDATQLTDAQSAISSGATVLVVDPLDSGTGTSIESYAKAHGVPVIDYDRLTLGGTRQYYVSFNNVKVGTLIGDGMVSCLANWKVAKPNLAVMVGSPTDNNATLFAQGYNAVLAPHFSSGAYVKSATPAGTWDPPTAETEFQQALTAHPSINAVLVPNDENAAPIITYLKTLNIPADKFPVTGQDATLVGIQNIISGYQCGTVYKPIYLEAQATAALALYLRAGKTAPAGLVNGSTTDTISHVQVKSVLLGPEWVTPTNVESTVVKDGFVPASQICAGAYAADCTKYGIS
ncbi:MAG: substrate-binding domain-containing protein [Acidimicrobiales bacterium]